MKINFKNVSHTYNFKSEFSQRGIDNVSISLETGNIYAIIGPTGSGKSTFVQHLNGLLLPTSGEIEIIDEKVMTPLDRKGRPIKSKQKIQKIGSANPDYQYVPERIVISNTKRRNKSLHSLRKKIGVVFQFPEQQLFESTVVKDVAFGPRNYGIKGKDGIELAKAALENVNLDPSYYERSPFDLSGGEQRKVAIAGILALEPEILVLDEPTAGLDPRNSQDILDLILNLFNKGHTIILITHDMGIALKYAHEIIVFQDSRLTTMESKESLLHNIERIDFLELPTQVSFGIQLKKQGYPIDLSKSLDFEYIVDIVKNGRRK